MYNLRHPASLVALFVLPSACGSPDIVGEREQFWQQEAAAYFETGRDLADLHSWLRSYDIYYTFEESELLNGQWTKGLETIYVDSFICDPWKILLTVKVDDSEKIVEYEISRLGMCW